MLVLFYEVLGLWLFIEASTDPVETFVDSAHVDAVIPKIDESSGAQACINGSSNMFAISNGTMGKGLEINQGDVRCIRA